MYLFVQKLMYSCKYQTILKDIEQWEKEGCENYGTKREFEGYNFPQNI